MLNVQQHLQMCTLFHATIAITLLVLLLLSSTSNATIHPQSSLSQVNQFLAPQNVARKAMGMKPLVWDEKVAKYAKWYANQRQFDCDLRHSNGPYGENIFWGSGDEWTPEQAVMEWVLEKQWYSYGSNSCAEGEQCGHYTQVVWSTTERVGCARVVCSDGKGVFMTCNYDPPGNYVGLKPY
ncbi:hypothetical protein LWI29_030885 [Acer saccharum]|uniref:Pathogenesis-related protein 1 n=1 Tax=Acer saccharum TaxID=4024 RepID=A0AA39SYQ5_ACESA|nr:hypothetical protein LWI29_030885 [Acer saccharum]